MRGLIPSGLGPVVRGHRGCQLPLIRNKPIEAVKQYASALFPAPKLTRFLMDLNVPKGVFRHVLEFMTRRGDAYTAAMGLPFPRPIPYTTSCFFILCKRSLHEALRTPNIPYFAGTNLVGDLLKKHPMLVDVDSKQATWQQDEHTALETFGEPLVDFDKWKDNAPLPDSVFDVPLFADAEITCSEGFLDGGRITYNGKESHIMSVVNARLNKNVVRRAVDRLLKIAGFGRTPTTNDTIEKVIPLRDVVRVGAPFATVVNYKVNKRANRMRSTILLFAFSKAQRGALKLRCPTHRDFDTSQGVVIGTALHMNNEEGMLRFMNHGTIEATFAYQDVQWVDPDF